MSTPYDYYKKKYSKARFIAIELERTRRQFEQAREAYENGECPLNHLMVLNKDISQLKKQLEMARYVGD